MSIRVMTAVWENGPQEPSKRFLLLSLADHASDAGANCFPGLPLLAEKTQISERQVQRLLRALEKDGWISILKAGGGRGNVTRFLLNLAMLGLIKGDKLTPIPKTQRVTSAPLKGDICDNPPHPLLGVTTREPSQIQILPHSPQGGSTQKPVAEWKAIPKRFRRRRARDGPADVAFVHQGPGMDEATIRELQERARQRETRAG